MSFEKKIVAVHQSSDNDSFTQMDRLVTCTATLERKHRKPRHTIFFPLIFCAKDDNFYLLLSEETKSDIWSFSQALNTFLVRHSCTRHYLVSFNVLIPFIISIIFPNFLFLQFLKCCPVPTMTISACDAGKGTQDLKFFYIF